MNSGRASLAPVALRHDYGDAELTHLMAHDRDPFNRWEAGQQLALHIDFNEKNLGDFVEGGDGIAFLPISDNVVALVEQVRKLVLFEDLEALDQFLDLLVGRIGVGRISQGTLRVNQDVLVMEGPQGKSSKARVQQILKFEGLERIAATEAGRRWPLFWFSHARSLSQSQAFANHGFVLILIAIIILPPERGD